MRRWYLLLVGVLAGVVLTVALAPAACANEPPSDCYPLAECASEPPAEPPRDRHPDTGVDLVVPLALAGGLIALAVLLFAGANQIEKANYDAEVRP